MKLPELTLAEIMEQREALAYAYMTYDRDQIAYAVESVDPDWTDHYHGELNLAFDDYWGSSKEEMIRALVEGLK